MSSQHTNQITDIKQLVKILNDAKDYFYNGNNEESGKYQMHNTVSTILDQVLDIAEVDPEAVKKCAESAVFAFSDTQKTQFINDVKNISKNVEEKYKDVGIAQLSLLLDMIVIPSITITSKGSTYRGSVENYELKLKLNITIKDIFNICRKFMDHEAHSIDSVEYADVNKINIIVNEST